MRSALMLCVSVMRCRHPVHVLVTSSDAGTMHWTGHDRDCRSAQRREPRRKEDNDQIDSEQSAHQAANLQFANQFRFIKMQMSRMVLIQP